MAKPIQVSLEALWEPPLGEVVMRVAEAPQVIHGVLEGAMMQSLSTMTRRLVANAPIGATGTIRNAIPSTQQLDMPDVGALETGELAIARVGFPKTGYEDFAERGRGPGRFPPEGPIISWIARSQAGRAVLADYMSRFGITNRAYGLKRLAYIIRRAHSLRGTARPAWAVKKTRDELAPEFERFYEQELPEIIADALEEWFTAA